MAHTSFRRAVRRYAPAVVVGAGLLLAGCSSTSNSASSTSTSAGTGASAGVSTAAQLRSLTSTVQAAEHGTYKVVYTATSSSGTQTVTIEQSPPKSLFSTSGGSVIDTGTTTYFCSSSNGSNTCITASGSTNPLASLLSLFSPSAAITALQQAQTEIGAHLAGYNVSFSSATYAGQDSTCVTVSSSSQSGKYCVTKSGILAYEGSQGSSFQLTSYSTTVASSDFSLPAGATVQTLPSGTP
ncbi:MAG TPA: hypothetical protein VMV14_05390 [Acidimicrobiales bacterium]|nr:hypothetical protein [Acidimicrobiales bacterium]